MVVGAHAACGVSLDAEALAKHTAAAISSAAVSAPRVHAAKRRGSSDVRLVSRSATEHVCRNLMARAVLALASDLGSPAKDAAQICDQQSGDLAQDPSEGVADAEHRTDYALASVVWWLSGLLPVGSGFEVIGKNAGGGASGGHVVRRVLEFV